MAFNTILVEFFTALPSMPQVNQSIQMSARYLIGPEPSRERNNDTILKVCARCFFGHPFRNIYGIRYCFSRNLLGDIDFSHSICILFFLFFP